MLFDREVRVGHFDRFYLDSNSTRRGCKFRYASGLGIRDAIARPRGWRNTWGTTRLPNPTTT